MTRRDLVLLGTEVKFAALLEVAAFAIGFAACFPFALRSALHRYRETR